jgi:hypothetical protein
MRKPDAIRKFVAVILTRIIFQIRCVAVSLDQARNKYKICEILATVYAQSMFIASFYSICTALSCFAGLLAAV